MRKASKARQRLTRIQEELRRQRTTQQVLGEQVAYLDEVAEDARLRSVIAETPLADRERRAARNDVERHRALLGDAERQINDLLAERDRLLDLLFELETAPRRRDDT